MEKPKDLNELTEAVLQTMTDLHNKEIGPRDAKAKISAAAVVICGKKLHLEYNTYMKTKTKIKFLECD